MQSVRNLKEIRQSSDRRKTQSSDVSESLSLTKQLRIVALIPRGEVIRNFVYTGCFDRIVEAANLSLLTVSPGTEIDEMLNQSFDDVHPLTEFEEKWIVGIQRDLLDMAHGRWLWSEAAQERWRLRDAEAKTQKQKTIRTLKKIVCRPFANRSGLNILSKIERATSRRFKTTDAYLKLFRELKPNVVFNGSHIHSQIATQAVQAAQWLGIPTATFIFSWDNLTSQGRIMLPYDYFLVWNEKLRAQLLEMYEWIRPEQVLVTGTPQFDFHFKPEYRQSRDEFCQSVGADPNRPIVLYSTGMANHMPGEPEIVEGIADLLIELDRPDKPQLLVRVYPKDLTGRFDALKARRPDILFPSIAWDSAWLTPKREDSYSLVNALRHAALGINVASTISLELCMFDKPVVNVGYNPPSVAAETLSYANYYNFDHYRPIVESGAVEVAGSREEMKKMIINALANSGERSAQRARLMKEMFGNTLDGNSGNRVAQTLLKIAQA